MKLGIRAKLFLISFGLIVLTVFVGYVYLRAKLEQALTTSIKNDMTVEARLIALQAEKRGDALELAQPWDELADELGDRVHGRVTFIRRDGLVLGDSRVHRAELPGVENHGHRPEVQAAVRDGLGIAHRQSTTVNQALLYVAVPFHRDGQVAGVARVALPLTRVEAGLSQLRHTLTVATLLSMGLALLVASLAAQLAARPARALTQSAQRMADGDLTAQAPLQGNDEFGELGRALDQVAKNLSATVAELVRERDRLSGILAGMQEGVLMLDAEGRVAVVNPALREMLLLGPDAVGKSPLEVIRHAELKELIDLARSREQQAVVREIELSGLKPRRLLVRVAPLAGAVSDGIFAVFVDVTDVRKLESMRRDFVANVSHELRTPVTAIRSAAETLRTVGSEDPKATVMFVDIIDRNAERLHGLVEDLLDLSRIESRAFKLKLEPLEVRSVFSHVISLFAERAQRRGVQLTIAAPEHLPRARADRRAMEQVLTNLVDNAVKYCGPGSEVRLRVSEVSDSLLVVVEDNGPGIEARHLPRVFERFYRVDAGRSRELGGTGLGLSIVKHLVEAMGSSVAVESTPGQGTSFSFTLRKWPGEADTHRESVALH